MGGRGHELLAYTSAWYELLAYTCVPTRVKQAPPAWPLGGLHPRCKRRLRRTSIERASMASCATSWRLCSVASAGAINGSCSPPSCLPRRHDVMIVSPSERASHACWSVRWNRSAPLARLEPRSVTPYVSGRLPLMGPRLGHRRRHLSSLHAEPRSVWRVREAAHIGGWAQRGGEMQRRRPLPPTPCSARARLLMELESTAVSGTAACHGRQLRNWASRARPGGIGLVRTVHGGDRVQRRALSRT